MINSCSNCQQVLTLNLDKDETGVAFKSGQEIKSERSFTVLVPQICFVCPTLLVRIYSFGSECVGCVCLDDIHLCLIALSLLFTMVVKHHSKKSDRDNPLCFRNP